MSNRDRALKIFLSGIDKVRPDKLIRQFVSLKEDTLVIGSNDYALSEIKNVLVIGMGKASAIMAQSLESIIYERIKAGHIITKYNHSVPLNFIDITEAGHPVPDENGIKGTSEIISLLGKASENDLVICLISGGWSSLLADLPPNSTLDDLKKVNSLLLESGADINEINCVRKHISAVKGGQLARISYPAQIISLILSDVIGDPLDVIASGPTVPDQSTFSEALSVIQKYGLEHKMPSKITQLIYEGILGLLPETPKKNDIIFIKTNNLIIGNNHLALEAARLKAEEMGYNAEIVSYTINGDVEIIAQQLYDLILKHQQCLTKSKCLLLGGEPTVKLLGSGVGGRNQHLAILMAKLLANMDHLTFLSGGTDGTDGPTDAAGAVVDSKTIKYNANIDYYINNFDSYSFFEKEGGLIKTGPTHTNVMDIMIILIDKVN